MDGHGNSETTLSEAYPSSGTVLAAPVRPTAADGAVTTMEGVDYTFTADNFNYAAGNANLLVSVIITEAPAELADELLLNGSQITDLLHIGLRTVSKADLDAGKLTFTPSPGGNGTSFKFKVNDGTSDSAAEYTMTITVTRMNEPTNTPPTASSGTVTTDEDTEHTFAATNFAYLDADSDTLVSVKITGLPASGKGTLTLNDTTITAGLPRTVSATDLTNEPAEVCAARQRTWGELRELQVQGQRRDGGQHRRIHHHDQRDRR